MSIELKKMTSKGQTDYGKRTAKMFNGKFITECDEDIQLCVNDILNKADEQDLYFEYGMCNDLLNKFLKMKDKKIMQFNGLYIVKYFNQLIVVNKYYGSI